jgi:hypothetical protein
MKTRILLHLRCIFWRPAHLWFHVAGILREFHLHA